MQQNKESKTAKWHIIVDVEKCENCNNCYMTLLDEYVDNEFSGYSASCPRHGHHWIQLDTHERGSGSLLDVAYLFTTCNQCANPACVKAAKDGAVYMRKDGIVMIDPQKAKGRKELVKACPYGHIWWNEEKELPQKWNWDAHLLDADWKEPRPISVCATGSLKSVKVTDVEMKTLAEKEGLQVLHPEYGTFPRVWYRNLYRYTHEHIAGSVAMVDNGVEDVVEGATVKLKKNDKEIATVIADMFGDFKFDAIEPDSGEYTIIVSHKDKETQHSVIMGTSKNVGVILL
ncbi:4Fe-4S dicluster domain-containing protein [Desulfovibrio sp. UCD-KL4C]|uniref:4Fe-4S dicluster domain-containing protein n=1 Tax=Desulfovibrio sp. UCD-KL4C TaxID=2578120 RepID=UPI0025C11195|nr:4Fe-4S dicluster domain-containing protein [Desulfovibrio sp. UCD-KL4C]